MILADPELLTELANRQRAMMAGDLSKSMLRQFQTLRRPGEARKQKLLEASKRRLNSRRVVELFP